MKRFLVISFSFYLLLGLGVWAYVHFALNNQLKAKIENTVNQDPSRKLSIGELHIYFFPPVKIRLDQVRFQDTTNKISVETPKITANVSPHFTYLLDKTTRAAEIELEFESPTIQIEAQEKLSTETESETLAPEFLAKIPLFSLSVKSENGKLQYVSPESGVLAEKLNFSLQFEELLGPWKILYSSENKITISKTTYPIPVKAEISMIDALKEKVLIDSLKAEVFGIPIQAKGRIEPGTMKSDFKFDANIDDLGKLSGIYSSMAQSRFSGALSLNATVVNETGTAWKSTGQVRAKQVQGSVNYPIMSGETQAGVVAGPFNLDAAIDFFYSQSLSFPLVKVSGDFKETEIKYGTFFHKPSGTRFSLNIDSDSDGNMMNLKSFTLALAQITASGTGKVATKPGFNSSLAFRIPKTDLTGLEKSFPPLSKSPLNGTFELSADVRGDFTKPDTLQISLDPLLLNSVSGHVDWTSEDKKTSIKGPLSLNARAQLLVSGKDLKTASVTANGNLTQLQVSSEGTFSKAPSMPLDFVLEARKAGTQINIKSAKVKLLSNTILFGGNISDPQKPNLDIWAKLTKFSYAELGKLFPQIAALKLSGSGSADIKLRGFYDLKQGFTASPLTLVGIFKTQIDRYVVAAPKVDEPKKETPKKPPEPVLPNWPVMQTANIRTQVGLSELDYGELKVNGILWNGVLNHGNLNGNLQIAKIFSGSINLNSVSADLSKIQPDIKVQGAFNKININEMATYYSPTWRDLVKGIATGNVTLLMPDSDRVDFKERLQAQGYMQVKEAYFSTIQIDQLIQEKLSRIPMMAEKAHVRTNGLAGEMNTQFQLANGKMNLDPFHFETPDDNELKLKGWVGLDAAMDLAGAAYLAKSPVKGSVHKANSDERGRLVVPLALKGNLKNPELSLAEATVTEMLEKTAKYELKLKEEEFKKKANEKIQEELGKKKEDLKKNIEGLFGR